MNIDIFRRKTNGGKISGVDICAEFIKEVVTQIDLFLKEWK